MSDDDHEVENGENEFTLVNENDNEPQSEDMIPLQFEGVHSSSEMLLKLLQKKDYNNF